MSDLMREEFEAWFSVNAPDINNLAADRAVKHMMIKELAFLTWQASRECLVIDLPPEPECPEDPEEAIDDSHMDAYHSAIRIRNACSDSIHAVGVKTK